MAPPPSEDHQQVNEESMTSQADDKTRISKVLFVIGKSLSLFIIFDSIFIFFLKNEMILRIEFDLILFFFNGQLCRRRHCRWLISSS